MTQTPEEKKAKAKARREARKAALHERRGDWLRRYYWRIATEGNFLRASSFYGTTTWDVTNAGIELVDLLLAFMTREERERAFAPYLADPDAGNPQTTAKTRARYAAKRAQRRES